MSSTMPPVSASRHSVYCARPGPIRPRSLLRVALTNSTAPGPRTTILPRWLTSKMPTADRTALCSSTIPEYCSGISQPPNSANFAPSASCRSCSGERDQGGRRRWLGSVGHDGDSTDVATDDRSDAAAVYPRPHDVLRPAYRQPCQDPGRSRGRRRGARRSASDGRHCPARGRRRGRREGLRAPARAAAGFARLTGKAGEVAKVPDQRHHRVTAPRPRRARCRP